MTYYAIIGTSNSLSHHGVKGQRWGKRNYQNEDGSYKSGAEGRYDPEPTNSSKKPSYKVAYKNQKAEAKAAYKQAKQEYKQTDEYKAERSKKIKTAAAIAGGVAAAGLAAYGGYKLNQYVRNQNAQVHLQRGRKEVERMASAMSKMSLNAVKNGTANKATFNVNENAILNKHLNNAQRDSFTTAIKNVYNYRKNSSTRKPIYKNSVHLNGTFGR